MIYDGNKRIIEWSADGHPLHEITLKSDGYIIMVFFQNDYYWAEERTIEHDNIELTKIVAFDREGDRLKDYNVFANEINGGISYRPAPIIRRSGGFTTYYNNFNTNLYKIESDSIIPLINVDFGKYSQTCDKINDMRARQAETTNTAELLDIISGDDELFLLMRKGKSLHCAIIGSEGCCRVSCPISDPRAGGGIPLWKNTNINFWPQLSKDKKLFALLEIPTDSSDCKSIIDHALNPEISLTDDSNPCVIIAAKQTD